MNKYVPLKYQLAHSLSLDGTPLQGLRLKGLHCGRQNLVDLLLPLCVDLDPGPIPLFSSILTL